MAVLGRKCGDFTKRDIEVFANITSVKMKEKKLANRIDQTEKDEWIKLLSTCGADPKFFNDVLDPKEVGLPFASTDNNRKKSARCIILISNFLIYSDFQNNCLRSKMIKFK